MTAPGTWEATIALTQDLIGDTPLGTVEISAEAEDQRYQHDGCDSCRYIGRIGHNDVWVCEKQGPLPSEVCVREGGEPWDYHAGPLEGVSLPLGGGFWLTGLREIGGAS